MIPDIKEKLFENLLQKSIRYEPKPRAIERLDKSKVIFRCLIAFEESFELICSRFIIRFEPRFSEYERTDKQIATNRVS